MSKLAEVCTLRVLVGFVLLLIEIFVSSTVKWLRVGSVLDQKCVVCVWDLATAAILVLLCPLVYATGW